MTIVKLDSVACIAALTLLTVVACSGRNIVEFTGAASASGGMVGSAAGGNAGNATARGGTGALAGGSAGEGTTGGATECVTASDCPAPHSVCSEASCAAGVCGTAGVPKGTLLEKNSPADCHASVCDGFGGTIQAIDLSNVPQSLNGCAMGSCDAEGTAGNVPVAARVSCQSSNGGTLCDGAGNCVECLVASDCPANQQCVQSACVSPTCKDGQQDGSETDIDCGGACAPCADTLKCKIDQDCASDACEPVALKCLPATCIDDKVDQLETDIDCGGGTCSPCYTGKSCLVNSDCATQVCTGHACAGNPCADHRLDGDESDIDCGGECKGCTFGQTCFSNFDCATGYPCNLAVTPPLCQ